MIYTAPLAAALAVAIVGWAVLDRLPFVRQLSPRSLQPVGDANAGSKHRALRAWTQARQHRAVAAIVTSLVGAALLLGPLLAGTIAACILALRATRPVVARRRRTAIIARSLPDVADLIVLSIRAGLTPRQAIAEVAPVVPSPFDTAFAEVGRRTERGESFPDALRALPELLGIGTADIADTIATGERYGLPIEPLLDDLATQARATRRRADQADARALPVRLAFPLVTCTLPAYVLVAIVPAVLAALTSLGDARP